jgi:hypothetical protein
MYHEGGSEGVMAKVSLEFRENFISTYFSKFYFAVKQKLR